MKSLKFLSFWVLPAFFVWWEMLQPRQLPTSETFACPEVACKDTVNVRLDEACQLMLQPKMVISGELDADCLANLKVEVFYQNQSIGNTIPSIYVGQVLTYKLTNTTTGNICWGHVRVEDKTPPLLTCPDNTDWVVNTAYANILTGNLSDEDFNFQRRNFTCWLSAQTPEQGTYYYDTLAFKVAKDGVYTFVLFNHFVNSNIATGAIFQGSFDENSPCQNIIGFSESRLVITNGSVLGDWWNDLPFIQQQIPWLIQPTPPFIRMELALKQNQTYYLVTTSLKPEDTGDYAWLVFRDEITQQPNNEILKGKTVYSLPWIAPLVCDDLNRIKLPANACYRTDQDGNIVSISNELQKILQLTGFPHKGKPWFTRGASVHDNCGDITICVGDQIQLGYGTCDSTLVKRTFVATDATGNGSLCTQIITIRKPRIQDVVLPNFITYIECDEEFPVDSTGYPAPTVTGYPFVRTAFGLQDLNKTFCTLGATYANTSRVNICDKAYTFIREWTIYDWCNPGSTLIYKQLIKVGDFTPPEVVCQLDDEDCPIIYSTGPFACTASITIPAPDTIIDNCSNWRVTVDVVVVNRTPIYDENDEIIDYQIDETIVATGKKPGEVVGNIPRGLHYFRYRVTDDCGNTRVQECEFEVEDRSEPIAICKDFLNISMGTAVPIVRLSAADVDAGSFDNCSTIKLQVRRVVDEDCIDTYESLVYEYGDTTVIGGNPIDEPPIVIGDGGIPPIFSDGDGSGAGGGGGYDEDGDSLYYTKWADFVYLTCCDVGRNVRIELRVWDDADGNGIPGEWENVDACLRDIEDNYNKCWMDVLVEDKSKPVCKPPLNMTIACTDSLIRYESTFSCDDSIRLNKLFGDFVATDNCYAQIICSEVLDERDNCGVGKITRIAYAEDDYGNRSEPCKQVITITPVHNYEIKFPADVAGDCKVVLDTVIETQNLACDLLAVSVEDERFLPEGDECFKVHRTFRVINWCEYDGLSDPIIVSRDEDCDGKPGDEPVYVLRRPGNTKPAFIDRNNNELDQVPAAGIKGTSCDGTTNPKGYWRTSNSSGYWQYTQVLKVYDTTPPEIYLSSSITPCVTSSDCKAEVTIPFLLNETCTHESITFQVVIDYYNDNVDQEVINGPRIRGEYPKYRYIDSFPIGEHTIEIRVKDGCNNTNSAKTTIHVEDCKAPTPVCLNGLAAELMPVRPIRDVNGDSIPDAGAAVIWANDFIASEVSDCTGPVTYSISRLGEIPDRNQTSLLLTCADVGTTLPVAVYAWDHANNPRSVQPDGTQGGPNYAFCLTYVLVQDNLLNCANPDSSRIPIAGRIATENDVPVEGVNVAVQNGLYQQTQTNTQGFFGASANIANGNTLIDITPELDQNYTQGVTTFDIILITKHILGSQPLDSPYKMIAADINNSGSITLLDVIQLRKLILGVDTRFDKNRSWRFVEKAFEFPNPDDPWATIFPEKMRMDAQDLNTLRNADFVAVKIGDVNLSAGSSARNLPATPLEITVADEVLEPFKTYQVSFVADLTHVEGYQFTLQFAPEALELKDIAYGVAQEENFGWRFLNQGQITTSWNPATTGKLKGQQTLFTLVFSSKTAGRLQDFLSVRNRPTDAEAYDESGNVKAVNFSFQSNLTLYTPFTLYQNIPNPFSGETTIGFFLPEAGTAHLQIFSADGRLIKLITSSYSAGYQSVKVSKAELSGAGVYYYTLESNGWKATRKMLLN